MYLPADLLHTSGVLAVVTAGFVVSHQSPRIFTPQARLEAVSAWQVLILLVNGIIFVLIGLQMRDVALRVEGQSIGQVALYAAAVSAATIIIRLLWVAPAAYIPRLLFPSIRRREPRAPLSQVAIVGWTGMRGVVSLAAALSIPLAIAAGALAGVGWVAGLWLTGHPLLQERVVGVGSIGYA